MRSLVSPITSVPNWHRYIYYLLAAIIAVCAGFQFHAFGQLPVGWENVPFVAEIVSVFVGALLPAFRDTSGPNSSTENPPSSGG